MELQTPTMPLNATQCVPETRHEEEETHTQVPVWTTHWHQSALINCEATLFPFGILHPAYTCFSPAKRGEVLESCPQCLGPAATVDSKLANHSQSTSQNKDQGAYGQYLGCDNNSVVLVVTSGALMHLLFSTRSHVCDTLTLKAAERREARGRKQQERAGYVTDRSALHCRYRIADDCGAEGTHFPTLWGVSRSSMGMVVLDSFFPDKLPSDDQSSCSRSGLKFLVAVANGIKIL